MIEFYIDEIRFSGGDTVQTSSSSLILLIGPNSSGKSTALTNLANCLGNPEGGPVLGSSFRKIGTVDELHNWLQESFVAGKLNGNNCFWVKGDHLQEMDMTNTWNKERNLGKLRRFLIHQLATSERLQIANRKHSISLHENQPSEYIHLVQLDGNSFDRVTEGVRSAFGRSLIINWAGGPEVWFHVGNDPDRAAGEEQTSSEYVKKLRREPELSMEGDGIKSYVGCLLALECGAQKILLIDEPEAFLHPAQARRLGGLLAESSVRLNRQVFAATHSPDIVKGALDSGGNVAVCRITRTAQNTNHAKMLGTEELAALWSKPLLQSANAIQGLFHESVVVCEADSDCRFFEHIVRRITEKGRLPGPPDVYFAHGGGKGELATLAGAYSSLGVATAVVADFDLLRNRTELQAVVGALGGDWDTLAGDYDVAINALNELPPTKTLEQFLSLMEQALEGIREIGEIGRDHKAAISSALSQSAKWSEAKKHGIGRLKGGAHAACDRLLDSMKAIGLFPISTGELESFWRGGPARKDEWILEAIQKVRSDSPEFSAAEGFMVDVCKHLSARSTANDAVTIPATS